MVENQELPLTPAKHIQAAKASCLAPVIAVLLNMFVGKSSEERIVIIAVGAIAGIIIVAGLVFALWGIIGAFRKGPIRVLIPAFVGLLINGFLVYISVYSYLTVRQFAQEHRAREMTVESDEWVPSGEGWHVDLSAHFAIKFPDGWEVIPNPQDSVAVIALSQFVSPEDRFRENITIVTASISPQTNAKNLLAKNYDDLRRTTAGYEEHGTGIIVLNGIEWQWIDYQQSDQGVKTRVKSYMAVSNSQVYAVSCSEEPNQSSEFKELFDNAIATIRIP